MNTLPYHSVSAKAPLLPANNIVVAHYSTWNCTMRIINGLLTKGHYDVVVVPNFRTPWSEGIKASLRTVRASLPGTGPCPRDADRQWESLFRSILQEADNSCVTSLAFCNFCTSAESACQHHMATIATETISACMHSLRQLTRIDLVIPDPVQADIYAHSLDQAASLVSAGA